MVLYYVHTFVGTNIKNMIYRTKLYAWQVKEVKEALLSKKAMEQAALMCIDEDICGRDTAYRALNPEVYDPKNVIHRNVLDAAVRLLKLHNVQFAWNETGQLEAA